MRWGALRRLEALCRMRHSSGFVGPALAMYLRTGTGTRPNRCKSSDLLVRPAGIEPATPAFGEQPCRVGQRALRMHRFQAGVIRDARLMTVGRCHAAWLSVSSASDAPS